jgi:hypothetical protein
LSRHVANIAAAAQKRHETEAQLGHEALIMAQWAKHSSAAAAVQQMGLRFAAGSDALAAVVRERQDISTFWRDRNNALVEAMSKPEGQRNQVLIDNVRKQITKTERAFAANTARLEPEFPQYASLASPKPIKPEEIQQLLGPGEVLLYWLTGEEESYVFALTRDEFVWKTISLGSTALAQRVAAFRRCAGISSAGRSVVQSRRTRHSFLLTIKGQGNRMAARCRPASPRMRSALGTCAVWA